MVIKPSFDKDNIYNFFNIYIIIINLKKAFNPLKWIFQIQLWFSTIYHYNTIFRFMAISFGGSSSPILKLSAFVEVRGGFSRHVGL
jgi:hypothetical protein